MCVREERREGIYFPVSEVKKKIDESWAFCPKKGGFCLKLV